MADLIERYKITANLPSVLMNYCNRFNSKQLESITEMIYELENSIESADVQPVNQWISVDDKLPDTVDDCLVWYSCDTAFGKSKSVGISFCSRYDWYKKHLNGDNIVVLYWMPLPEPPKDGDTNG